MAQVTSGQVNTGSDLNSYFYVKWTRTGTWNDSTCGSYLKWELYLHNEAWWYSNALKVYSIDISGNRVYNGGTWSNYTSKGDFLLASGTYDMQHASDGTKTFRVDISAGFYDDGYASLYKPVSGSGTFEMVKIPRASSISSIGNDGMVINGGNALTVNISRADSSFLHIATFTFGSYSQVVYSIATQGSLTVPLSWIGRFGNGGSGSLKGTVSVQTYASDGKTPIGSAVSKEFTLTCPSASSFSLTTSNIVCNGSNAIGVNISRSVSSFTHTVRWGWGSYSETKTGIGTSTSYSPPTSWLNAIPNENSGYGGVTVTTYYGSQQIGSASRIRFDMSVPSYSPNFSGVTVALVQDTRISDWGIYVQKYSRAKFTFNGASGVYGSSIKRYAMEIDGVAYENFNSNVITSNIINGSGSIKYGVSVRDTRNKESYKEGYINVEAFVKPTYVSHQIYRYDGEKQSDSGEQLFFNLTFTYGSYGGLNSTVNKIYIKRSDEDVFAEYRGNFENGKDLIITDFVFDYHYAYTIRAVVTDELGNSIQVEKVILDDSGLIDSDGPNNSIGLLKLATRANFVQIGGGLEVDGTIYNPQGMVAHKVSAFSGNSGYDKFATITILNQYADTPLIFEIAKRDNASVIKVHVMFRNEVGTDPELESFYVDNDSFKIYIHKSATSTWDLYIYNGWYEHFTITRVVKMSTYYGCPNITWQNEYVSSLPSGYVEPEVRVPSIESEVPLAGALDISKGFDVSNQYRSFIGSWYDGSKWYNAITVRHRNNLADGTSYGMFIRSEMTTTTANLVWNQQNAGNWGNDRTILDSANISSYAYHKGFSAISDGYNINNVVGMGQYQVNEGWSYTNGPNSYLNGVIFVPVNLNNNIILQIYSNFGGDTWLRMCWFGTWYGWKRVDN